MGAPDQSISAGLGGFFALFLLAAALWLLMRSLLKHLRNAEHHHFEQGADDASRGGSVPAGMVQSRPARPVRPAPGQDAGVTEPPERPAPGA